MPLLKWRSSYTLGIPSVDLEHRELIDMINEVYAGLENEKDPEQIQTALGEILAGISAHFALEERLMRDAGYDEFEDHKGSHEELLDEIRELMDAYAADPVAGRELLRARLSDWFAQHFATFDARLHDKLG